ncbi:MAG: hypothetical protein ACREFZ_10425, partial [Acetobacteraceae bacterium]
MERNEAAGTPGTGAPGGEPRGNPDGRADEQPDLGFGPGAVHGDESPARARILAALAAARYHGFEPDPDACHPRAGGAVPSPADLAAWLAEAGLW